MPRSIRAVLAVILLIPLLSASGKAERNLKRPPGTTRYAPMLARLNALLAYDKAVGSSRMQLSSIGTSVKGRSLWMVTLHDTGMPAQATTAAPQRLFYLCRQHGHEPASTEGALTFLTELVHAFPDSPLSETLKHVTVYVVPMANPDGAEAFLRHNAHNRDLNRDWLKRTQLETQAWYRAIMRIRPDMMTDQHELYPDDTRGDFTETAGPGSGASQSLVAKCDETQSVIQAWMGGVGCTTTSHIVTDRHPARLAHRYGCVVAGVPTILFETSRLNGTGRTVAARGQAHERFMMAVLRDTAGEREQLLAEAGMALQDRTLQLASRKKPYQRAAANQAGTRPSDDRRGNPAPAVDAGDAARDARPLPAPQPETGAPTSE